MGTAHVGYGSGRNSMLGKGAGVQQYLSISLTLVTGRIGKEELQKPARDRLRSLIDERAKIVVQT